MWLKNHLFLEETSWEQEKMMVTKLFSKIFFPSVIKSPGCVVTIIYPSKEIPKAGIQTSQPLFQVQCAMDCASWKCLEVLIWDKG